MTDSAPQYQRATAEDERWLEDEILGEGYEGNTSRVERYRRILNSLRATPAVPDREALARALYAASVSDEKVQRRLEAWDTSPALDDWVRDEYLEKVDRMMRVLGGFPAVLEQIPVAWRIEGEETVEGQWAGSFDYITDDAGVAEESAADGHKVTPLYAAAPQVDTQTT